MVNEERMRKTFCELVEQYAPSKGEREVCEYLKKKLKALGASKVVEDDAGEKTGGNCGNLIAVFNADTPGLPSIALTGHMDCVEVCKNIQPVLKDGVFRSAGDTILGSDDKAGVTAILEGLAQMKANYIPHGKITVIFTVQEESGLDGSRVIDPKYLKDVDFAYVLDADGPAGTVYNAGPGQFKLFCTMHGKAAHAGIEPEKGVSAIAMMAHAVSHMKLGRIDDETTCNVGIIEGGIATNIVPETCSVKAEARSRSHEKLLAVVEDMKKAFQSAEEAFPGGKVELEVKEMYQAFVVGENEPALRLFRQAAGAAGFKVRVAASGGGSDANWYGVKGCPALLVGAGMTDFHTNNESLKEQDLYDTGELVYRLIEEESHFQMHGK